MKHVSLSLILLTSSFIIVGCGGSGSDTNSGNEPVAAPTPAPPIAEAPPESVSIEENGLYIHGKIEVSNGESVGYIITAADQVDINQTQWTQLSGPPVSLLAAHTQAIGFDVPDVGNYSFQVTTQLSNGETRTVDFDVTAADNGPQLLHARLDHVATEGGRVSIRVDSTANQSIERVEWNLIQGPTPTSPTFRADDPNDNGDVVRPNSLFYTAPRVSSDQVMRYQISATFEDGTQAQETVMTLIDNTAIDETGYFPNPDIADLIVTDHMIPYRRDSPYANALRQCVYNNTLSNSCSFNTLPLLGSETRSPNIEDVLNRTLVSHPWMGMRFEEYLRNTIAGQDMLNLLRGTTAVVISYDIRPSFYWSATGAIYLDANNLWRTAQERDTLNTAPDFRASFGSDLQFSMPWRYVDRGTSYLRQAFPQINLRTDKPFDALEAGLSWLMYHELAHANDVFPPSVWSTVDNNDSPVSFANRRSPDSTAMSNLYPLSSSELKSLAQVSFLGETATQTQREYTTADIESFYVPDDAPAYYAYSTIREDYATLFERFMMLYRYNIPADTAIVEDFDAPVQWAVRGRISSPALRNRLAFAVTRIYPELDFNAIYPTLTETVLLPTDLTWGELLGVGAPASAETDVHKNHAHFGLEKLMLHRENGVMENSNRR
jgi:hypothetical protein